MNRQLTTIGPYAVIELIGQGGFGNVYKVRHPSLQGVFVAKVANTIIDQEVVASFQKEANLAKSLNHPNIVQVFDFGFTDTGVPYIIMAYQPFGSLAEKYPSGTRVPLNMLVSFVVLIGNALQYAHEHQVIHGDVKPENMFIGEEKAAQSGRTVRIGDFGTSQALPASKTTALVQVPMGTPQYSPPELFLRAAYKTAGDQYMFAAVIFEWLAGRPPFVGSVSQMRYGHINLPPPTLRSLGVNIPHVDLVDLVLQRALVKDAQKRFPTMKAFVESFRAAISGKAMQVENHPTRLLAPAQQVPQPQQRSFFPHWNSPLRAIVGIPQGLPVNKGDAVKALGLLHSQNKKKIWLPVISFAILVAIFLMVTLGGNFLGSATGFQSGTSENAYQFAAGPTGIPVWESNNVNIAIAVGGTTRVYDISDPSNTAQVISSSPVAWHDTATAEVEKIGSGWEVHIQDSQSGVDEVLTGMTIKPDLLAWSPDGNHIAAAGGSGGASILIWDTTAGGPPVVFPAGVGVTSIAWSFDSSSLAYTRSAKTDSVGVVSASGQQVFHMSEGDSYGVSWAHSGSSIAFGGSQGNVIVLSATDGTLQHTYSGHTGTVTSTSWSAQDDQLASGSTDTTVRIWNVSKGGTVFIYRAHKDAVTGVAWSPDGARLASASTGMLNVWAAPPTAS